MTDHLEDELELYALGGLEPSEAEAVEVHVKTCAPCAQRLAEAQAVGASLAATLPRYQPSRALSARITAASRSGERSGAGAMRQAPWWLAVAAAIALLVTQGWQNHQLATAMRSQSVVLATIAHSHFRHTSVTTLPGAPNVTAKALYARDGSWVYLILDRPPASLHVRATSASGVRDLGTPMMQGDVATFFVQPNERITNLELIVDGAPDATASLAY